MNSRRKCINCLLAEENNKTGYHKYILDIQEENGDIKTGIPAYGIDMQDALKRVIRTENKEKLNRIYVSKVEPTLMIILVVGWISSITLSTIWTNRPEFAFYGTIGIFSIVMIYSIFLFFKHLNRD